MDRQADRPDFNQWSHLCLSSHTLDHTHIISINTSFSQCMECTWSGSVPKKKKKGQHKRKREKIELRGSTLKGQKPRTEVLNAVKLQISLRARDVVGV